MPVTAVPGARAPALTPMERRLGHLGLWSTTRSHPAVTFFEHDCKGGPCRGPAWSRGRQPSPTGVTEEKAPAQGSSSNEAT